MPRLLPSGGHYFGRVTRVSLSARLCVTQNSQIYFKYRPHTVTHCAFHWDASMTACCASNCRFSCYCSRRRQTSSVLRRVPILPSYKFFKTDFWKPRKLRSPKFMWILVRKNTMLLCSSHPRGFPQITEKLKSWEHWIGVPSLNDKNSFSWKLVSRSWRNFHTE